MARLWQTGFELNDALTADLELSTGSGAVSVVTSPIRSGTYAGRSNAAGTAAFFRQVVFASDQSTQMFMRVYLRIASLPLASVVALRIANVANGVCTQIVLTTGGTLILNDAASVQVGSASAALSLNTQYMIDLSVDASTNPGTVTGRLDGTVFATGANSSQAPWSKALCGVIGNTTADLAWDDWAVNDASGTRQTSFPGPGKIIHLLPSAAGDANTWLDTAAGAGSTNNFQLVDEVTPNDATDMVQAVTLNAEDMYNLTNSGIFAGDTVNCVLVGARFRNNTADATTAFRLQARNGSGGTTSQSASIIPNTTTWVTNAVSQPKNYPLILHTDPNSNPWSQATLDSLQAGVKITAAGVNRVQVSAVWVSVDYTPSTAAGPPPPPSARRFQRLLVR